MGADAAPVGRLDRKEDSVDVRWRRDLIQVEGSVVIDRPTEQVWEGMSNVAENVPKWDRGVLAARVASDGPLGDEGVRWTSGK